MSEPQDPKAVTSAFWDALYARHWERVRSFFGPESIYLDVPTGPAAAARGPENIEKRLRLGLEKLSGYGHGPATVVGVADGRDGDPAVRLGAACRRRHDHAVEGLLGPRHAHGLGPARLDGTAHGRRHVVDDRRDRADLTPAPERT